MGSSLLSPERSETAFAKDLTKEEKALLVAIQPQTAGCIFGAKPTAAAWHTKPPCYIVASNDNMIAPEQEKTNGEADQRCDYDPALEPCGDVVPLQRGRKGYRRRGGRQEVSRYHHLFKLAQFSANRN
jgi:hypothetical protein